MFHPEPDMKKPDIGRALGVLRERSAQTIGAYAICTVCSKTIGTDVVCTIGSLTVGTDAVSAISGETVGTDVICAVSRYTDRADVSVFGTAFSNEGAAGQVALDVGGWKCKCAGSQNGDSQAKDQCVGFHDDVSNECRVSCHPGMEAMLRASGLLRS